jgi:hypothetical protein
MIEGPAPEVQLETWSKVPAYRAAFRAYVERETAPTPSDLAKEFNLHPVGICQAMDRQHWATARIVHWSAKYSVDHVHLDQLAGQVQDQVCGSLQDIFRKLLPALAETIEVVTKMPTAPPTSGPKRGKSVSTLCRAKLDLAKLGVQVMSQATDCALKLGLAVPVRGKRDGLPERHAGMIDLSADLSRALGTVPGAEEEPPAEFEVEE